MPSSESRRSRERRLRAKYRKQTIVTSVVTLVVGLVLGFALCVLSVNHPGFAQRLFKIGPLTDVAVEPDAMLPISDPDAEAEDISGLNAYERTEKVDSEDGTFDEFAEENAEAIKAFAAEEANALAFDPNADGDGESAPAEPDETEEPAESADTEVAVQVVETEVSEGSVFGSTEAASESADDESEEGTAELTLEVTPEPTPEPTPVPPAEPIIVPFGQTRTLETQILADGSKRTIASDDPYETLNLTMKVDAYKNPEYFQQQYATQYKLQGDEAAVEFDITLNGYTGVAEIIPQNFLLITFIGSDPSITIPGYQLMDAEIAGKRDISITSDITTKLYKRYPHTVEQGDMQYMAVTTYNDGVEAVYWFEILAPEPDPTPEAEASEAASASDGSGLTVGSQGDDVIKLQKALIKAGVLSGNPDGKFGNYTAEAIKQMQKRFGMEQTGIADQAFLDRLYADQ